MAAAGTTITDILDTASICSTGTAAAIRWATIIGGRYWGEQRHNWYVENRWCNRDGGRYQGRGRGYTDNATPGGIGWPERNGGRMRDGDDFGADAATVKEGVSAMTNGAEAMAMVPMWFPFLTLKWCSASGADLTSAKAMAAVAAVTVRASPHGAVMKARMPCPWHQNPINRAHAGAVAVIVRTARAAAVEAAPQPSSGQTHATAYGPRRNTVRKRCANVSARAERNSIIKKSGRAGCMARPVIARDQRVVGANWNTIDNLVEMQCACLTAGLQ